MDVAKRPKYQLVASILYLLNFQLRKINRRVELFKSTSSNARLSDAEEEYENVLDAIVKGITENYGDDMYNHVLDLVQLRRGHDSVFEAVLRTKTERQ